jgi:hypothetical protein
MSVNKFYFHIEATPCRAGDQSVNAPASNNLRETTSAQSTIPGAMHGWELSLR